MSYGVKHAKTIMWITSESTILDWLWPVSVVTTYSTVPHQGAVRLLGEV